MNKPTIGPNISSLRAAATRLGKASVQDRTNRAKRSKSNTDAQWQVESWDMYDVVGELRFLATNLAGQAGRATLYVGKQDGDDKPERVEDQKFEEILDSLSRSTTGRGQLIERMFLNMYIAGEGWLVGIPPEDGQGGYDVGAAWQDFEWKMLSVSEVSTNHTTDEIQLTLEDGERVDFDSEDLYLIRVWRSHPRRAWEADSPTRSAMPVLKELVGLTMHISAQVESRLAGAGLLVVPQSAQRALSVAAGYENDESEANAERDEFTEALIEAMITPIGDRDSAAAVVPLVVTVPDEAVDAFNHITFSNPLDAEARSLRDEAIRRLALSMDAPPELLLGTTGMNHWGGWLVQEETVSSHIEPTLQTICHALTTQYLWPMLEEEGYSEDDLHEYVIHYDVEHLIVRPNQTQDAFNLHDKGAISDDTMRRVTGFDDSDKPERPVDLATSRALEMVAGNPQLLVNPGAEELVTTLRALISGDFSKVEEIQAAAEAEEDSTETEIEDTGEDRAPDNPDPDAESQDPKDDEERGAEPRPGGVRRGAPRELP